MLSKLEKLMFSVELIDKASGGIKGIMGNLDMMHKHAAAGMQKIAGGAAGLYATGFTLKRLVGPSVELGRAMGEVASLDVSDDALAKLSNRALMHSLKYGEGAAAFVSSSYDIQSAIAGLNGTELGEFTSASNILAKATKSDAATITDYTGTMYGIFQNTANEIGKANWVKMLAGQTATAVQMFKTTGSEMSSAFTTVGAEANAHGVAMSEQMAILGTLQATMSGAEAGTKYKSFLAGVGKAQDTLGMTFTDTQGRMLPMVDILERISGRFGEIDTVAESDLLQKAFGRKEAVGLIKLLMSDTQGLAESIDKLGRVQGMNKAIEMAEKQVDIWDQFDQTVNAVAIVFGRVLQPVLTPVLTSFKDGAATVIRWTELFPNLTAWVGKVVLGFLGITAAVSLFALFSGIASIVMSAWNGVMLISRGIMLAWGLVVRAQTATLALFRIGALAASIQFGFLKAGILTTIPAVWGFTAALWANPITWIVLGVVALIAAIAAAIICWDEITAAVTRFGTAAIDWIVAKWEWLKGILQNNAWLGFIFAPLRGAMAVVETVINNFQKIPQWFAAFKDWVGKLDPFAILGEGIDWIIDKINMLPGIEIERGELVRTQSVEDEQNRVNQSLPSLAQGARPDVPAGGMGPTISQAMSTTNNHNRGMTIEKLEVNTNHPVNGNMLYDELAMAAS